MLNEKRDEFVYEDQKVYNIKQALLGILGNLKRSRMNRDNLLELKVQSFPEIISMNIRKLRSTL